MWHIAGTKDGVKPGDYEIGILKGLNDTQMALDNALRTVKQLR